MEYYDQYKREVDFLEIFEEKFKQDISPIRQYLHEHSVFVDGVIHSDTCLVPDEPEIHVTGDSFHLPKIGATSFFAQEYTRERKSFHVFVTEYELACLTIVGQDKEGIDIFVEKMLEELKK